MDNMDDTYSKVCTYENLALAFQRARKHKTKKLYVIEFEQKLKENLLQLQQELETETYKPKPLITFILRDPKTRKISKSDFRDRVVHHAICNIIEPKFDKTFIYDSYANRLGKGTLKAIKRFDEFKRKVSKNNTQPCYFLKADIKHYFDTVSHQKLLEIIARKIPDDKTLRLIKYILENHKMKKKNNGMPLGNLTSQFFANIYLNELDQYVKHELKVKYYIRYVDDFVILSRTINDLINHQQKIDEFVKEKLDLELHPDKTKIIRLEKGADFLGFRIFYNYKLIRKKNLKKYERNFSQLQQDYSERKITRDKIIEKFEGWLTYTQQANTYKYRRHIMQQLNQKFSVPEVINPEKIKRHETHLKRVEAISFEYSPQKTLHLYKKGLSIKQIAEKRNIKESTIY
jgi:RNA-directed DNA polymerase